jgi:hypothetical protein
MKRRDEARMRARNLVVALTVLTAACRSVAEPEPGTDAAYERALAPTLATDTLQAKNIVLVDEKGQRRLLLSGSASPFGGPMITLFGEEEEACLLIGLGRSGLNRDGPAVAVIHAESGDFGNLQMVVEPDGAHLRMGSDETDGFGLSFGKDGVVVAIEPKDEPYPDAPGRRFKPRPPSESGRRGVRVTLEQGKIVVRDLAGRELGILPDATPIPAAPK